VTDEGNTTRYQEIPLHDQTFVLVKMMLGVIGSIIPSNFVIVFTISSFCGHFFAHKFLKSATIPIEEMAISTGRVDSDLQNWPI
jgi:hypothetical protein